MRRLLVTVAALVLLAGCGDDPEADSNGSTDSSLASGAGSTGAEPGGDAPGDLCALVTDEELTDLLGTAPEGVATESAIGGGSCLWTDDATGLGLELGIAPESVPPGDGVREVAGALFFPLGGREANLRFIDFEGGDHLDEIRPLVALIQAR